jgi:hypothetical protein
MRITKVLALAVAAAAQAGCGSGTGGSSSTPPACDAGCPQLTPEDEAFLTSYCTTIEACCVLNAFRPMPDVAGCKATLAKNGFSRDPAVQSACLGELQDRAATGATCLPSVADLSGPCARLFYEPAGAKAPGEACTISAQCNGAAGKITLCVNLCIQMASGKAGDGVCMGAVNEDGVIIAAPVSQPNTSQPLSTGVVCERSKGLYCAYAGATAQTCQPLDSPDYSCNMTNLTGCTAQGCGEIGKCAVIVPVGQACGGDTQAACDRHGTCVANGSGFICTARLPAGSPCTDDDECESALCSTIDNRCGANRIWDLYGFCGRTLP